MNCEEARRLMDSYMDGTISRKDLKNFAAHVRSCGVCHTELETNYLVAHAQDILDNAERDSFDIKKMVDDDLVRRERGMRRKLAVGILIWILLIVLGIAIVAICVSFVSPGAMVKFLNGLADFFRIQPDWQFWKDFSFLTTSTT